MNWKDQVVLVTGGTGSFGKKFIKILLEEKQPKKVIVFSRDELKQHEMQVGGYNQENLRYFIGDIRDRERLERALHGVDIVVQELATDHPGDIAAFGEYLHPVISIVTAVTPEHMEFFGTLDAVAHEELSVAAYSALLVMNSDDIAPEYVAALDPSYKRVMYGSDAQASYRFDQQSTSSDGGFIGTLITPREPLGYEARLRVTGEHSIRSVLGAVAAAAGLEL